MKGIVKIIETNLSLNQNTDEILDHQSRVIEVNSWDAFIDEIKNVETVDRHSAYGHLWGVSIPRESKIENLKYDGFHLSCDIYNYTEQKTKKLAYVIE